MSPVIRGCRLIDVPFWWPGRFAKDDGDLRKDGGEYGDLSVAAIDDPSRIRRSRDIGVYLGLVPRRHQSGEVDYVDGISKCGDRRMRTLLHEAANVMLTR
jgi:Transposase IS116/IS110/IS902 family